MYCEKCGKEIAEGTRFCAECGNRQKQNKVLVYSSAALAILSIILPFLAWLKVPVVQGLYSIFGMQSETPTFSLFGYIFAGSQYQSGAVYIVMMLLALTELIGIVFNLIYAIKALRNKPKSYKYGTIGAIISTVVSVLFIAVVGLMCLILKIFKMTATPYILLIIAIANIVIIRKLKKQNS